ncbi:MAG: TMEM165/GDT1 family protein [Tolypothrix brevis GSE-NOS-MK-07-07A]|nr:TMEM165/GDT1 family protein [Tolypothrix brevis GSE-NOS-MK-07-07A]
MKLDEPLSLSAISPIESETELINSSEGDSVNIATEQVKPVDADFAEKPESALVTFGTTFITIFLAEIGDKTQLSTLLMSAQSHSPWVVFMGSAAALITTSLLGVLLGSWISSRLSPKTVEKAAGVMLLLISIMLFWDVVIGY